MALIAVVEDNRHLRDLLRTLLRLKQHEVKTFPNGLEALNAIDDSYDLVLSDVQMPKLDGISMCLRLREVYGKTELPVIIISVLDGEDDILRALEAGANDYLCKPFSPALVKAKVAFHLKQREPKRQSAPNAALDTKRWRAEIPGEPTAFPVGFDRYTLEGVLGRGSYGVVYDARRDVDGLSVALKILDKVVSEDREMLARYFREIGSLSSLDCTQIVSFVASGYEAGRYYLAMEKVKGRSAWDLMQAEGPLHPALVARIGADMSSALAAISSKGLVHRDLKPANIVICDDGCAKLVDFGLVKGRSENDLTSPDEFLGTAEYIAPEVIRGAGEDVGSDLYALGVALYELLLDENPFTASSTIEVLKRVASGRPAPAVHTRAPQIPGALSSLIACLMHPDRHDRLMDPIESAQRFRTLAAAF